MAVRITFRIRPDDSSWSREEAPPGLTIARAVEERLPRHYWPLVHMETEVDPEGRLPAVRGCYEVLVNDEAVEPALWERAVLEDGDRLVIVPVAHGFFDNWKQALLGAVITVIGAALISNVGGWTLFALGALSFFGTLALAALAPKFNLGEIQSSPTYSVQGVGNRARHWQAVPQPYGRFRAFPPEGARQYPENVGDDQAVRFFLDCGRGPLLINDIRMGNTPLLNFFGVDVDVDGESSRNIEWYTHTRREERWAAEMTTDWWTVETEDDSKELIVGFLFPRGLTTFNTSGGTDPRSVTVAWEYRELDSGEFGDTQGISDNNVESIKRGTTGDFAVYSSSVLANRSFFDIVGARYYSDVCAGGHWYGGRRSTFTFISEVWRHLDDRGSGGSFAGVSYRGVWQARIASSTEPQRLAGRLEGDDRFPGQMHITNVAFGKHGSDSDPEANAAMVVEVTNSESDSFPNIQDRSFYLWFQLENDASAGDNTPFIEFSATQVGTSRSVHGWHRYFRIKRGDVEAVFDAGNKASGWTDERYAGYILRRFTRPYFTSSSIEGAYARGLPYESSFRIALANSDLTRTNWANINTGGSTGSWSSRSQQPWTLEKASQFRRAVRIVFPSAGRYEVRFRRTHASAFLSNSRHPDTVNIESTQSVVYESPIVDSVRESNGHISGRIRASRQLSGIIDDINALMTYKVQVWESGAWREGDPLTQAEYGNPAWIAIDILKSGTRAATDEVIDLDAFVEFAAYCESRGYYFNGVIDQQQTKGEAVQTVLEVAHASLHYSFGRYGVIWNDPGLPVVQVFSPRTIGSLQRLAEYSDDLDGARVSYVDPDRNWTVQEVIAYVDGRDESNSETFQAVDARYITSRLQAERLGRFFLAERIYRSIQYTFSASWDALVCQAGSRVLLQGFDITDRVLSARILETDGSSWLAGDADPEESVDESTIYQARAVIPSLEPSKSPLAHQAAFFKVKWSSLDQRFNVVDDAGAASTTSGLAEGQHVIVGESGSDVVDLRIQEIRYQDDGTAVIQAVEWHVDEIHDYEDDVSSAAPYSPFLSEDGPSVGARTAPPAPVLGEVSIESIQGFRDQNRLTQAVMDFDVSGVPSGRSLIRHVSVSSTLLGTEFRSVDSALDPQSRIQGLKPGRVYVVEAWHRDEEALISSPSVTRLFIAMSDVPVPVQEFVYAPAASDIVADGLDQNGTLTLEDYRHRFAFRWSDSRTGEYPARLEISWAEGHGVIDDDEFTVWERADDDLEGAALVHIRPFDDRVASGADFFVDVAAPLYYRDELSPAETANGSRKDVTMRFRGVTRDGFLGEYVHVDVEVRAAVRPLTPAVPTSTVVYES